MKPTAIILPGNEPVKIAVSGRVSDDSGGVQVVMMTSWDSKHVGGAQYALLSVDKARELAAALVAHAEALEPLVLAGHHAIME